VEGFQARHGRTIGDKMVVYGNTRYVPNQRPRTPQDDELEFRKRKAQQDSMDARQQAQNAQDYQRRAQDAGYAQQSKENAANRTAQERMGYIGQGVMPPESPTGTAKPSSAIPLGVQQRRNEAWTIQEKERIQREGTPGRISARIEGIDVNPEVRAGYSPTEDSLNASARVQQRMGLNAAGENRIRGFKAMQSAIGAQNAAMGGESLTDRQETGRLAAQPYSFADPNSGVGMGNRVAETNAAREQWNTANDAYDPLKQADKAGTLTPEYGQRLADMRQRYGMTGAPPATTPQIATGATPMPPGATIPPQAAQTPMFPGNEQAMDANRAALAMPVGDLSHLNLPPITTPGINPEGQRGMVGQTATYDRRPAGFDSGVRGIQTMPIDIGWGTSQGDPGLQGEAGQAGATMPARPMDATAEYLARNAQTLADARARFAALPAEQPQALIPGGLADRQNRDLAMRERAAADTSRVTAAAIEAQPIVPTLQNAIDTIPEDSSESTIGGLESALSLAGTEKDVTDLQQAIKGKPWYLAANSDPALKAYIETLIYNRRAAIAKMPLKPMPARPAPQAQVQRPGVNWNDIDTGMLVGG
jgi:hypothetical protein